MTGEVRTAGVAIGGIVADGRGFTVIEGNGRVTEGETDAVGRGVDAGTVATGVVRAVAVANGELDITGETEAVGDGRIGCTRGDADTVAAALAAGVIVAVVPGVAVAIGAALTAGFVAEASGVAVAAGVALTTGVALTAGFVADTAGVAVAATVAFAAGVAVDAGALGDVSGFTNVFGGAFGGGVASDLIFFRARSAAERSAIAFHPVSIAICAIVSFTVCGRSIPGTLVITGAEISISSPRTLACNVASSISACRRKR